MELDGPVFIYQWKNALTAGAESLTFSKDLIKLVAVPFREKKDHAEGLALVTDAPLSVLVCYDSPDDSRLDREEDSIVKADIFDIPS